MTPAARPPGATRRGLIAGGTASVIAKDLTAMAQPTAPQPFRVALPQAELDRILARVRDARLPTPMPDGTWQTGLDAGFIRRLQAHWLERFDWRAAEARLNAHPQFLAPVEGQAVHFYHVPGRGPAPKPVLVTHGWPYSPASLLPVVDRLTDPARFGGRAEDALTLVLPSIPGYGFSAKPAQPQGPAEVARLWRALMVDVLGYQRFGVQGGDHGAVISAYAAGLFPGSIAGMHLNLVAAIPSEAPDAEEQAWLKAGQEFMAREFDYFRLQADKPDMVSLALTDSPLGAAAWIAEKFNAWADGGVDAAGGMDAVLTETVLYLATDSMGSGFWHYRALRDAGLKFHPGTRIAAPTAVYLAPREFVIAKPPRPAMERSYNLVRETRPERGGHFPFLETPEAFAADIGTFFAGLAFA